MTRPRRGAMAAPRWIPLVAVTIGCATTAGPQSIVERDSAGIRIVQSTGPVWSPGNGWVVAAEPRVTVGVPDGADAYQLYRVVSARRLEDGRIVIANAGTSQLRFYDAAGRFLFQRGGEGKGPAEFMQMGTIWRVADTLLVFDYGLQRISVYSTAGTFARSIPIRPLPDGGMPLPVGAFTDRTLLVRRLRDPDVVAGAYRDTSLYLRYSWSGELIDTVGPFAGDDHYVLRQGGATFGTGGPFGRRAWVAVAGSDFFFGSSDTYEIERRSASGALEQLIRRPLPNPPVSDQEARDFHDMIRERAAGMAAPWRALYRLMEVPKTKPAYGRLLVDADGNLWVAAYRDESEWSVFDARGRLLGTVELPPGGRVLDIGHGYVLGVWSDEADVEQVRLYELLRHDEGRGAPGGTAPSPGGPW